MAEIPTRRLMRPETLTAIGVLAAAAGLMIPAIGLKPISALLPVAMLTGLILLGAVLLISDQRKAVRGEAARPMTEAPGRVAGAFALIVAYALAVDFTGFYPATTVSVPLVAWLFGYRQPLGLAVATAIVVASIWLIFSFAMMQDFPAGRLWSQ